MGGSKQPSVTTQIQKTELPAWVDAASQGNYAQAEAIGQTPYEGYTGPRVAGLSAGEQAASGTLQGGIDRTNAALGGAGAIAGQVGGFKPGTVTAPGAVKDVTAQSFLSGDINKYMDPNIQSVIDPAMASMRREIDMGTQAIGDEARGVGAWGGSRHGVREAVYGAEGVNKMAQTEAGLRSAAFTDAAGRMDSDNKSALQAALANQASSHTTNAQGLQAQTANQQAGIAGAGLNLQAGSLLNQIGQTSSDTAGRNAILQDQLGAKDRSLEQQKLDNQYASWQDEKNHPTEQLNLQLAALGMSPYGKTTSGTTTQPNQNSSNGVMQGIGAAASILPLLFSDRKVKKNVKKIGKVPGTDLNKYEFEYKPGFMGRKTPKQIGLMADDVKRKVPGAVVPQIVNGKKVDAVNYEMAIAQAPRDPRNDKGKIRGVYRPRGIGIGARARAA